MGAKFLALIALLLLMSGCALAFAPGSVAEQLWFLREMGPFNDPYYNEHEQAIVLGYPGYAPGPGYVPTGPAYAPPGPGYFPPD
jgi:hypothetical protein